MRVAGLAAHTHGSRAAHSVAVSAAARQSAETGTRAQLAALIVEQALTKDKILAECEQHNLTLIERNDTDE